MDSAIFDDDDRPILSPPYEDLASRYSFLKKRKYQFAAIICLVPTIIFFISWSIYEIFDSSSVCKSPEKWDDWEDEFECKFDDFEWWKVNSVDRSDWNQWNDYQIGQFEESKKDWHLENFSSPNNPKIDRDEVFKALNDRSLINFATIYKNKNKQSRNDHGPVFGDIVNYDHLPPKSAYTSECNRSKGKYLPTVAILAQDHKGPIWSYCTQGPHGSGPGRPVLQKNIFS